MQGSEIGSAMLPECIEDVCDAACFHLLEFLKGEDSFALLEKK